MNKRTALILAAGLALAGTTHAADWTRCESADGEVKMEIAAVNVNTATVDQLALLYRVGPATAAKIVAGRPYARPLDILAVRGLGPSWWRANGLHVTTEGETTLAAKVGAPEETEPLSWRCSDGRQVELVVEEASSAPAAGGAVRRVVQ